MDDEQFLTRVNGVARQGRLSLPALDEGVPSHAVVAAWAGFLEGCLRRGVELGDPRWRVLSVYRTEPVTVFTLSDEPHSPSDEDFRLGLQLLMGTFDKEQD